VSNDIDMIVAPGASPYMGRGVADAD